MRDINNPSVWESANIGSINPNLTTQDFLNLMWMDISDFKWKKVASIWGWFWILEMDLAKTWKTNVEIVDPLFSDPSETKKVVKDTYKRFSKLQQESMASYEYFNSWIKNDLFNDLNNSTPEKEIFEKRDHIRVNLWFWHSAFWLDDENFKLPNTLKLNPSYWENIQWIEPNSQDFIFINHLLYSFPYKLNKFLSQADKILKPWWTIFIVDYNNSLPQLQEYFKKNWTYKSEKDWWEYWTFCGKLKKGEWKDIE